MATDMNMSKQMGMSKEMSMNGRGGHLYMQTNEVKNAIIHYHRSANGTLTEVERVATGGAGSGTFKPISGQESAPNSFEGAGSVILSPDRKFLLSAHRGLNEVIVYRYPELEVHTRVAFPPMRTFYKHLGRLADTRLGFHHAVIK